jgi:hemerythrin-like domain-containing protein
MTTETPPTARSATQLFRIEHLEIKRHLDHVADMVEELHGSKQPDWRDVPKWREKMEAVVKLLNDHVRTHSEWEEKALYPVVDRYAKSWLHPFTATMRFEHHIIARRIEGLAHEASRPAPDVKRFARQADHLLGLIAAHFEAEEEVLLSILDSEMTHEEFEREVMNLDRGTGVGHGHHGHPSHG